MDLKHHFVRPEFNRELRWKRVLIRVIFKSYFFPNYVLILRLIAEPNVVGRGRDGHFQRANKRIVKRQLNDVINSE